MGIPLRLGRDITWQDREQSGHVVVVNESLAHALFGTGQPIGQRLIHPNDKAADAMEIIGVCADAKFSDLRRPAPPTIYEPYVNTTAAVDDVRRAHRRRSRRSGRVDS
jgi:hypothetical protein